MMEYVMQHDSPYLDCNFNRERLCRLAGFNRHMALQSLRSQGYNDIHEYIMRYRVAELKRRIESGEITDLKQVIEVGFAQLKPQPLVLNAMRVRSSKRFGKHIVKRIQTRWQRFKVASRSVSIY